MSNTTNEVTPTTMPEKLYAKKFSKAFLAGERSDIAIHKALIMALIDFTKSDNNTVGLGWIVKFMIDHNKEGARTNAVIEYLKTIGKFKVQIADDNNVTVRTTKKQAYDSNWLDECKATPWYKVARTMQVAKAWSDPFETMKRQYATGFIMGDIDRSGLLEVFSPTIVTDIITMSKTDEKLQAKVAERMKALAA